MTVLLGTLWSLVKQIEAPYMFDWENASALDTKPENQASSRGGEKCHGFSRVAAVSSGIFSSSGWDVHSKVDFVL